MRGVRQWLPWSSFEVISELILLKLLNFDKSFRKDRASRMTKGREHQKLFTWSIKIHFNTWSVVWYDLWINQKNWPSKPDTCNRIGTICDPHISTKSRFKRINRIRTSESFESYQFVYTVLSEFGTSRTDLLHLSRTPVTDRLWNSNILCGFQLRILPAVTEQWNCWATSEMVPVVATTLARNQSG